MNSTMSPEQLIYCGHEEISKDLQKLPRNRFLRLDYENQPDGFTPNIKVSLQPFIRNVNHLPSRVRDLLEIAAYVFNADRSFSRGQRDAVEFHSWSRNLNFNIKVRDFEFWNDYKTKRALSDALEFMSGDERYSFTFSPGRPLNATNLFDKKEFLQKPSHPTQVSLFSGGLDSLAGAIEILENSDSHIYLVSHRPYQPSTSRTQDKLIKALIEHYGNRLHHYKFYCSFKGVRARDENQRTRSFLYTSIAYAITSSFLLDSFYVYENGITAINFPKREDMGHARASRTTHPKTIYLMERLFSLIAETKFTIQTPFLWSTKADVFQIIEKNGRGNLLSSAVSCSRTFRNTKAHTHCGECSQCIDRRIAAYSVGLHDYDHTGLYTFDILRKPLSGETKTLALDFVRVSGYFAKCSIDDFHARMINELVDICDFIDFPDEIAIQRIYDLHCRHGQGTIRAINRMVNLNYDYMDPLPDGSFLRLIVDFEHLKDPVTRLINDISEKLLRSIPLTFQRNPPKDENDFNDKVYGILISEQDRFEREHPSVSIALAKAVPDHSSNGNRVLIESKYLRKSTTPSKASEGIAADLTKYPKESTILFVVYDPFRSINDDEVFRKDFEDKKPGMCHVLIVR